MRILIKSGTTEQILCDGAARGLDRSCGPVDLRISGAVIADPAEYLRASAGKVFNRGNLRVGIAFGVHRECSSPAAAEKWLLTHLSGVLREDTLILQAVSPNGAITAVTVSDCALGVTDFAHVGASVHVTYQIQGGALS